MGRNRKKRQEFFTDHFWQTDSYNFRTFHMYFDMLLSLAINRFRWTGMPDSCNVWYFEKMLHKCGIATFSHAAETPDVWTTLTAMPTGEYNMYGYPTKWRAVGYDGLTDYDVTDENGALCFYSWSRYTPWNYIEIFARKMAHYSRTEDVNLSQQMRPFIGIAPQEKKMELVNLLKQIDGGEPAVLGDSNFGELVKNVTTIDLGVPFIGEELARGQTNVLYQALMFLGIPHLAFEKGERMIEEEARANSAATNTLLLDCLNSRREFCETINRRFGMDVHVYFNDDIESYNFNYMNNIEAQAQDGLIMPEGGNDDEEQDV